jgi:hypothetical protein
VNEAIRAYSEALDEDARALFFPELVDSSTLSSSDADTLSSVSIGNCPVAHCSSGVRDLTILTRVHPTNRNSSVPEQKQPTPTDHPSSSLRPPKQSPSLPTRTPKKPGRHILMQDTPPSSPTPPHSRTPTEFNSLADSLDASLIRVRFPDRPFERKIHHPPLRHVGSAGRWYIVCVGRQVGVFNEWYASCMYLPS